MCLFCVNRKGPPGQGTVDRVGLNNEQTRLGASLGWLLKVIYFYDAKECTNAHKQDTSRDVFLIFNPPYCGNLIAFKN